MNVSASKESNVLVQPVTDQSATVTESRILPVAALNYARSTHEFKATSNPPPHHNHNVIHPYNFDRLRRDHYMIGSPYQGPMSHGLKFPQDELHRAPFHGTSHAHTANLPRSGPPISYGPSRGHPFHFRNQGLVGSPVQGYRPRAHSGDVTVSSPHSSSIHRTPSKEPKPLDREERDDDIDQNDVPIENEDGGCTCKKSKCLKLYCMCFANKAFCDEKCRCLECRNDPQFSAKRNEAIHTIIVRNPTAFDKKFHHTPDKGDASQHRNGCKCRKSMCLKKYCECFHAQVNCGMTCRCVGCKNIPPGTDRPSSDLPPPAIQAGNGVAISSNKNNFNVMDAAHNLATLKTMMSSTSCMSKDSSSGSLVEIHSLPEETRKVEDNVIQADKTLIDQSELHSIPVVDEGSDKAVHDTFAADLLLRAASVMIQRTSQQGCVLSGSNIPCPSEIGFDINYPKRQLQEPLVPGISFHESKRQKFEKDCKSPNSAADKSSTENASGFDEKISCKTDANSCEQSIATRILKNLHFEQEQT